MINQAPIPQTDAQLEELLEFVIDQCFKYEQDLEQNPINPPRCENKRGPAKYGALVYTKSGMPIRKTYTGYLGEPRPNSGRCPHCDSVHYRNAALEDVIKCPNCQKEFSW